jgi:hypothetical protein
MTKKELEQMLNDTESAFSELRHDHETLQKVLDSTKEELRLAKNSEKEWRKISANDRVERDEWKKMALHLMEQLVKTKAELEVAKLPF